MAVPQKIKPGVTSLCSKGTPGYAPKELKVGTQTLLYIQVPTLTALLTMAKPWKQPKCPLRDEQNTQTVVCFLYHMYKTTYYICIYLGKYI